MLRAELIDLSFFAPDVESAILRAGELLVAGGACDDGYVQAMLRREKNYPTAFAPGFALPHGELGDLDLVRRSALSIVRLEQSIVWGEIEVRVVFGLAAKPGENLEILGKVADVAQLKDSWAKLVACQGESEVLELFGQTL